MARFLPGKYAAIGFVASKVVLPLAKRRMKKRAKGAATGAAKAGASAVSSNPGRASLAVGSAVGALGFLIMRKGRSSGESALRRATRRRGD